MNAFEPGEIVWYYDKDFESNVHALIVGHEPKKSDEYVVQLILAPQIIRRRVPCGIILKGW